MDITQIMKDVLELPDIIRMQQKKLLSLKETQLQVDSDIRLLTIEVTNVVRESKTPEGKPEYTNEKMREDAVWKMLNANETYSQLQEQKTKLYNAIQDTANEKEFCENKMRGYRILADLLQVKIK